MDEVFRWVAGLSVPRSETTWTALLLSNHHYHCTHTHTHAHYLFKVRYKWNAKFNINVTHLKKNHTRNCSVLWEWILTNFSENNNNDNNPFQSKQRHIITRQSRYQTSLPSATHCLPSQPNCIVSCEAYSWGMSVSGRQHTDAKLKPRHTIHIPAVTCRYM